jgi:23S rRNA (adenine2503-C2)-methyltransferase
MNLFHLSRSELKNWVEAQGEAAYRSDQIFDWIWNKGVFNLDEMSNLAKSFKETLKEKATIVTPKVIFKQKSEDGTIKYLLQLEDKKTVESVWIPREDQGRVTVCISTQVGCRMGCTFCMTAQQKTERNLTAGEIASQILLLPNKEKITNVVVMGMGEPFDNYDNLMAALDIITDPKSLRIGKSHVTVSTSGLIPAIERFTQESSCKLAISLNAPNNEIRNQIMPINKAYPIEKLLECTRKIASKNFPRKIKRNFSITFEYILMSEFNDRPEDALELVKILKGIPCKINLLQFNETPNTPFKRPSEERVYEFQKILRRHGYLNFLRKSRGRDISAACGQLASEQKRQSLKNPSTAAAHV